MYQTVLALWLNLFSELSDNDFLTYAFRCKVPELKTALLRHAIAQRSLSNVQLEWMSRSDNEAVSLEALAQLAKKSDLSADDLFLLTMSTSSHSAAAAEKLLQHCDVRASQLMHIACVIPALQHAAWNAFLFLKPTASLLREAIQRTKNLLLAIRAAEALLGLPETSDRIERSIFVMRHVPPLRFDLWQQIQSESLSEEMLLSICKFVDCTFVRAEAWQRLQAIISLQGLIDLIACQEAAQLHADAYEVLAKLPVTLDALIDTAFDVPVTFDPEEI